MSQPDDKALEDFLQKIEDENNAALDRIADEAAQTIDEAGADFRRDLPKLGSEFTLDDTGAVSRAMRRALASAGIEDIRQAVLDTAAKVADQFRNFTGVLLPEQERSLLERAARANVAWIDDLSAGLESDIRGILSASISRPLSAVELSDLLRPKMGTAGSLARTMVDTHGKILDREIMLAFGTQLGLDLFFYFGPDDVIARPYCHHMVMHGYTREMVEATRNGQLPNPLVTGGGYNCRHVFRPMSAGTMERQFPGRRVVRYRLREVEVRAAHVNRRGEAIPAVTIAVIEPLETV